MASIRTVISRVANRHHDRIHALLLPLLIRHSELGGADSVGIAICVEWGKGIEIICFVLELAPLLFISRGHRAEREEGRVAVLEIAIGIARVLAVGALPDELGCHVAEELAECGEHSADDDEVGLDDAGGGAQWISWCKWSSTRACHQGSFAGGAGRNQGKRFEVRT